MHGRQFCRILNFFLKISKCLLFLAVYFALFPVINLLFTCQKAQPCSLQSISKLGRISEEPYTSMLSLHLYLIFQLHMSSFLSLKHHIQENKLSHSSSFRKIPQETSNFITGFQRLDYDISCYDLVFLLLGFHRFSRFIVFIKFGKISSNICLSFILFLFLRL